MSSIYLVTISFNKSKQFLLKDYGKTWHLLCSFIGSLYQNGNILNNGEFFSPTKNKLVFYAVIPNKDALHASHLSYQALKDKDELEQLGVVISYKITADYVSETPIDIEENIENAKFLYLYLISWSKAYEEQLVLRTDEGRYLPLYIINDKDRYLGGTITSWKNDYAAARILWLSSYKKLEPLMERQLAELDSDISIEGRKISKRIQKCLKKKVFYPIAEPISGNSYARSNYSNCPSCKKDWQLKTTFHEIFDYKCNKCLLLGYELHS
ncbi:DUF2310 family Zn-ribbon-containing protein [Rickettsia felis]|uniref:Zn-ribbon-containing, possibly nucleic-acid-binding protein n=2 Tax=Rickettsia felis TaxID=42862 RepID=Q4UKU0_RICFE|nr:DUF2310 family Zn-ribbon-containing protein [Rickettsia felis]AAY61833.1 unknown [Rickettsia felis URRWXCal2]MDE8611780.1 DUF2310 family Zn-ribbon-containing protein [Rickettsia felis]